MPALSEGPLRDILLAPDRDRIWGAWPTVSFSEEDDPALLTPLRERMVGRVVLKRRGTDHGQLAVVDPKGVLESLPGGKRGRALQKERWVAARPLVLGGALARELRSERELDDRALDDLHRRLARADELEPWARSRCKRVAGHRVLGRTDALADPERDLARVAIAGRTGGAEREDLWVKSGRLSLHAGDRSLRVRVAFGDEGDDDASRDEAGHRAVAALGEALLPGAKLVARADEPRATLERLVERPVLLTQAIAYWNAPDGGARMHHDAFGAVDPSAAADESGQLGVAYAQLAGRTVWIGLSIRDLSERVHEFVGWLGEGDAPWIVEESLGGSQGLAELQALAEDPLALLSELARPGCGAFGPLVERGTEFTGALVDAGHACVLRAGDVILLPNHGPARTAMHAVFCAGPRPAYGMSFAIRAREGGRGGRAFEPPA